MSGRWKVAILGATGLVGQRFLQLLENHPWFEVTTLAASGQSAGQRYSEAANWMLDTPLPQRFADRVVRETRPGSVDADFVFSALDSSVAGPIEEEFARHGFPVVSNASPHRMDPDVPLLLADVNPDHIAMLPEQQRRRGFSSGFLVTNPNCSTAGLVTALKPLDDAFGVEAVSVVTLQAASGAGFPGVASMGLLDNVIPFIGGEEEKLETEPQKILGRFHEGVLDLAPMVLSAQVNRVPVVDGHMESVSVKLRRKAGIADIAAVFADYVSEPQRVGLPSAPEHPLIVRTERDRPQTRLDRMASGGMAVVVGRIRHCPLFDVRFSLLSHNTVRGAAGAALLNAEWLVKNGLIRHRSGSGEAPEGNRVSLVAESR
ncbi:MAG TPA: aspartate-semialdehyde dehydrogenase [Candidatus Dormibacteraeota bacterium]|nr:aspartate-semialdehyde dehydrogenase [Candidatus Dormibacteraeota bacterium]